MTNQTREVVPTGERKPTPTHADFQRAERSLAELREQRDTQQLYGASLEADALSHFYRRSECKEAADGYMRLKVLAEAAIGRLHIEENPLQRRRDLVLDGKAISSNVQMNWRRLGMADMRDMLEPMLDDLAADPNCEISSGAVAELLKEQGALWVDTGPLLAAFDRSGRSKLGVARATGVFDHTVRKALERRQAVLNYLAACALADELGVPRSKLRCARATHSPQAKARRRARNAALLASWLVVRDQERAKAAKRAGGKIEESYSLLMRCRQVLDPAEREITGREQQEAMRSAYHKVVAAADDIARALGVT